ncbi:oligosaccharide biosynthesis protein Alg14-like protein [Cunninghamella echinulata]|nr:oligosaccharide biosynthesis protein Alg14-like protein [Cunninghamella echinulata]
MEWLFLNLFIFFLIIIIRLWWILPKNTTANGLQKQRLHPCSTCIILGSGGHTAEMEQLIKGLDENKYQPRTYVYANNDQLSRAKIQQLEQNYFTNSFSKTQYYGIPRARNIKQSLLTTPWSFWLALKASIKVLYMTMPDTVICNGPGSCLPLCILSFLMKFIGIKHITLVYIESYARVHELSLTGKLLYGWVDLFLVQWPDLIKKYPKAQYHGILV